MSEVKLFYGLVISFVVSLLPVLVGMSITYYRAKTILDRLTIGLLLVTGVVGVVCLLIFPTARSAGAIIVCALCGIGAAIWSLVSWLTVRHYRSLNLADCL